MKNMKSTESVRKGDGQNRGTSRGTIAAAIATVALLATACSSGESATPTSIAATTAPVTATTAVPAPASTAASSTVAPSTTPPAITVAPTSAPPFVTTGQWPEEADILRAYLTNWEVFFEVLGDPENADLARIDEYNTGASAQRLRELVNRYVADGEISVVVPDGATRHDPEVTFVDGDLAQVVDCFVDDSYALTVATGETREDVTTGKWLVQLLLIDGQWKVSELSQEWSRVGVVPCDEQ